MGKELLNAESDALLLVVEVEDNDFDVLVGSQPLRGDRKRDRERSVM